jgi:type 1 glutamine amidotransferase
VRVIEDPAFLESPALSGYDVVILNFADAEGNALGDKARTNLQQLVEAGKGLVVLHHASAAWAKTPDYAKLAGRVWKEGESGHDPKGGFRVEVLKTENPIVKGLDPYDTDDELYYSLDGDQAIEVLATAKSKITGRDEPMAFVFPLGQGRVFHLTLGHDAPAIHVPGTAELLRRGTAWAAGQTSLTPAPPPAQAQSATQPAAS